MFAHWILEIRPKTLFASIAPVILGISIAYKEQQLIHPLTAFLTLFCALLLQMATNIANDYLDSQKGIDTNQRLGPIRVTQAGLIPPHKMKMALFTLLGLAFFLGSYLMWKGGTIIIIMGALSLYFAYGYTGGPYPLSYNGLGEVAAFVFFGVIAVTGTNFLQTHSFSPLSVMMSFGPGFISAAILAINNLRDTQTDKASHKRTLSVYFGETFQRNLCLGFILCSSLLIIGVSFYFQLYLLFPTALLPLLFMSHWRRIAYGPLDSNLNLSLAKTAQYLLLYCLMASIGILLSSESIT
ncbi:MAG: 1,4-dihydroxy-2-naphthoate polyprenyltransferase [Bacteriovorax sp.]|nr:1,4-dihydroxy-2-naphthoate polyprenyltransferase [Bacteriovorax sp.]